MESIHKEHTIFTIIKFIINLHYGTCLLHWERHFGLHLSGTSFSFLNQNLLIKGNKSLQFQRMEKIKPKEESLSFTLS